ncbi:NAD(+) diphosphatase [Roseovarius aestuarii]|uniref:NAD(+) diphosphatase n=1 Tax=Roseovarius aestuarii TaxID=475083 RepID=A0A1X7BUG5_9RHOB|nr:NAD(+) diphosphatase [Roseovarius aestuarii]SMC13150.1 NADH pyrophosphatase [Roseovarius aestuarii]
MVDPETVTFGGSGLDRAAELRGDDDAIAEAISTGRAACTLIWRGKPLVAEGTQDRLIRLPMDHPILAEATMSLLLGRNETGDLLFAHDISDWTPAGVDEDALNKFLDTSEQQHPALPGAIFVELRRIMTRLDARDAELAATARAVINWHVSHRFCACCGAESRPVQAGWQRSCDACGGQHFPRTDPVVIMLITRGNSVLMGRSPGWPEGMYSLLAGFVEPGETIEAAVRREVYEEAGIRVGPVGYLASQPWAFPSSLMIGCRGTALTQDLTIDPSEIEDARWFAREEILRAFAGLHPTLAPARQGAIAHFLLRNWLADINY